MTYWYARLVEEGGGEDALVVGGVMKKFGKVVLWSCLALFGALVGCMCFVMLIAPETKLRVTVENRTSQPLTNGTSGLWDSPRTWGPINPPLNRIPAGARVTGNVDGPLETVQVHYRVMDAIDDTVNLPYQANEGGVDWTFVVAEGSSLVVDSSTSIRKGHVASTWSRRQKPAQP
jgi:hypothetical protein